jgi:hypothetical protein
VAAPGPAVQGVVRHRPRGGPRDRWGVISRSRGRGGRALRWRSPAARGETDRGSPGRSDPYEPTCVLCSGRRRERFGNRPPTSRRLSSVAGIGGKGSETDPLRADVCPLQRTSARKVRKRPPPAHTPPAAVPLRRRPPSKRGRIPRATLNRHSARSPVHARA